MATYCLYSKPRLRCGIAGTILLAATCISMAAPAMEPCRIEVRERGTDWPVPLVELRTTHQVRFISDNAGVIAFDLPECMGRETWFDVRGHGYEVPADGFGYRGVRLTPEPGQTLRVEVDRTIIARRLGRLTGGGLLGECERCGQASGIAENGVLGCDSTQNAVHRGRLFWFWGDTTLARYPLGIFHCTGATTDLQPLARCEPPIRLDYRYFTDDQGRPRAVATMPGSGPTWVTGCVSLPDQTGTPRLVGAYMKVRNVLEGYQWGLCVWNEQTEQFEQLCVVWNHSEATPKAPRMPEGHAALWTDPQGRAWVLFGNPLPRLRCPATFEAWQDESTWESLEPQTTITAADDGAAVHPHSGSIAWNPWRKRWVTVFMEYFGKPSAFGEIWYAEADAPCDNWGPAVKVLSHDNYTFYNPCLHPEFSNADDPWLVFEGTFSQQFADRPEPTPRYDYNQILYRLDLDHPALAAAAGPAP